MNQLENARKYLGYTQNKNKSELSELLGVDPTRQSWCAAFVTAIERSCGRAGTRNLAARSYLHYGKAVESPQPGDIVIFWRGRRDSWQGHVGYYLSHTSKEVLVLGGNQDKQVKEKYYPMERVLGYRRPVDKNQ
jgi:uncharacterized protein (TIGR02594 family)